MPPVEIDATQGELADGLVHTVARALFGSKFVVLYCICGITVREVEVTDGIINLVEIVLVIVRGCHASQLLDGALGVISGHDLTL